MLKIGVIGLSEGNGHPYSWSAIFNGFNKEVFCPFDVIPEYLSNESFPENFLTDMGKVTHIWTQDRKLSESVANFAYIDNIVDNLEDMLGRVDAVLLARDDAENHYEMAKIFIENNIPIFIDKPLAYSTEEANQIYALNRASLIYSCSSIRFAKEFSQKIETGVHFVQATVMKSWEKYSVHIIEPVISMFPNRGTLLSVKKIDMSLGVKIRVVEWENLKTTFTTVNKMKTPVKIEVLNDENTSVFVLKDTFYAFRESLRYFINVINNNEMNIPRSETMEVVEIIEKGM